jgi:hypothetical protein
MIDNAIESFFRERGFEVVPPPEVAAPIDPDLGVTPALDRLHHALNERRPRAPAATRSTPQETAPRGPNPPAEEDLVVVWIRPVPPPPGGDVADDGARAPARSQRSFGVVFSRRRKSLIGAQD